MSNIRQYLSQVANPSQESAPFLNAFLDGADEIIAQLEQYAEYAQDQFFFTTADAEYVFKLAARNGFYLPRDAGLNIDGLKPLAPLMINQPKTTQALLLQILEIYFSQILARPNIVCAQPEPYRLTNGDDFIVQTRETTHRLSIDENLFADAKRVSAAELATYINSVQEHYIAITYFDRTISKNKIRLIAGGQGANEIIQVKGGTLQNLLLFPDVVPTTNTTQTEWLVSKPADYSDIVTFQHIGGIEPSTFAVSVGDIVTFRNQFDVGASGLANLNVIDEMGNDIIDGLGNNVVIQVNLVEGNYSALNGSFDVIEVGYDYFKIRNKYLRLPINNEGVVTQLSSRDIIFTKNLAHRVYEQSNFSYLTELTNDQLIVTVPAVPPIVKRFLEGSWHIYGAKHSIKSFSRNFLMIDLNTNAQLPTFNNSFVLQSSKITPNFNKKFKITTVDQTSGSVFLDTSDEYEVFPYTAPTLILNSGSDPFFCNLDSDLVEITFSYKHGLYAGAKIALSDTEINPESGILLDGPQSVDSVLSPTKIAIRINNKNIGPVSSVSGELSSLGSKKYQITYFSLGDLVASKLTVGKKFKLFNDGATVINNIYIWEKLKARTHTITGVVGNTVQFETTENFCVAAGEIIATSAKVQTTALKWGNSFSKYYFDTINEENVSFLNNLELVIADYIKPTSPLYLGSYLYDPQGVYYKFLSSAIGTQASAQIFKGEAGVILPVDSTANFSLTNGYLVFDYGTSNEEGPVKYLAISGNQIIIDPAYTFQKTHLNGFTVREVKQLKAFTPIKNGKQYQPFLTGTSLARDSFFEILKSIVSAGVFIQEDVLYPELRFADDSIKPYE